MPTQDECKQRARLELSRLDQFNLPLGPDTGQATTRPEPSRGRRVNRAFLQHVRAECCSIEIAREVRDFAVKQNSETYLGNER